MRISVRPLDVLTAPAYGLSETGRMLHLAKSTAHRWVSGWDSKGKWQPPMLKRVEGRLSFQDLAELSVVQQLRARGVSVKLIQDFATAIRDRRGVDRPFLQGVLIDPDGKDLLIEEADRLISTKTLDQRLIREALRTTLVEPERILIEDGVAVRVFPFSRDAPDEDPQLVAIDPRYRFGKPVTSPSLIDIDGLVIRLSWGETFEDMADALQPDKGVAELEEGVRYWLGTMTTGQKDKVDDGQRRGVEAFRNGESIVSIARREKITKRMVVKHLGEALEIALAA